ncbi:MAG: hypothetical protein H0T89_29460 [Deltaproteobacteria bacterium]|nr:hypothetical protein [Deltaproteobacteria bacterium]MDQ3297088.1 hypothetical protein [Myxococcota bacterium]
MDPSDPSDPNDPPDDPTPVDEVARDYDDIAATLGASARIGELSAMLDVVVISEGGMPDGFTYLGVSADHFHQMSGQRGGVSFNYLYHCNDAADVIVPTCDGTANHSHVTLAWDGDMTSAAMSMTGISNAGEWTIRDLSVDKPRVGGEASISFDARVNSPVAATYSLTYDTTFDRVRFAPGQALPVSGKIDFAITAMRVRANSTRNFSVTASLLFAAGTTATITLDGNRNYSLDLTTGVTTKL